jgi:hypothetical protein
MRCAIALGVLAAIAAILDESFASTATKMGSTQSACPTLFAVEGVGTLDENQGDQFAGFSS